MAEADPNLSDAHTQMPSLEGRKAVITALRPSSEGIWV